MFDELHESIRLEGERNKAFEMLLAKQIKPYRAYSIIYKNACDVYNPHLVDWIKVFTPIEEDIWCSIRYYGLPMNPQYPFNGIIFDFADPFKKIAIECDGSAYHNDDADAERDAMVGKHGWKVIRIPGHVCRRTASNPASIKEQLGYIDEDRVMYWRYNTGEGVISQIAKTYYNKTMGV